MGTLSSIIVPGMDAGCWRLSDAFPQKTPGRSLALPRQPRTSRFPKRATRMLRFEVATDRRKHSADGRDTDVL
jgi:hypothetical protein